MLMLAGTALAQQRIEIAADTLISTVGSEAKTNSGGSARLKTKGSQELSIFDFDVKGLRGRTIKSATLHFRCVSPDAPQRRVSFSTITAPWVEGKNNGYTADEHSAAFLWSGPNKRPWSFAGSDLLSVINGQGGSVWRFSDPTPPDAQGWQTFPVAVELIAMNVAGLSHGLSIMDDVGSEYERNGNSFKYKHFPNRFLASREQGNARPYLMVETGPEDQQAPGAVGPIRSDAGGLPAGEAIVSWEVPLDRGPAGVVGFEVTKDGKPLPRYLIPHALGTKSVHMHLRDLGLAPGATAKLAIRAVDGAGNRSPETSAEVKVSDAPAKVELHETTVKPFEETEPLPRVGTLDVSIIDSLDKVNPLTGAVVPAHDAMYLHNNHLFSAKQKLIRLHAGRNEFVEFQVLLSGVAAQASMKLEVPGMRARLYRFRHVNTKAGLLPDPLVAADGPVTIPAKDEKIEDQKHAGFIAEILVPRDARAGGHKGTLTIACGGETMQLSVELQVWNFTLPDALSFYPEMNCYGLPDAPQEVEYYRLAQEHRTVLNRLGYNWRGQVNEGCGPRIRLDGSLDFTAYDARFGPLLDGSAFKDLPRGAIPVEAFYLPINENWPVPIEPNFKGGYWIESAFKEEYRPKLVSGMRAYAKHLAEKGWNKTYFEFYLNNKVYFKDKSWDRCSAPWIFDEPSCTQDFWALRWYGQAFHEAVAPARGEAKFMFRCDISRPQWQREMLDGVMNVNIIGGAFRPYQRMVMDRKAANGELVINYGTANRIEDANAHAVAWSLDAWTLGADGVLPWQTIGKDTSWTQADELSLFYPGKAVGQMRPQASVRLKAYRQGQQLIEYLTLLEKKGHARHAIAASVRELLQLKGQVTQTGPDDAGTVNFGGITPEKLWELRMRIGGML